MPHLSSSSEFVQSNDQLNAALLDTSDTIGPFVLMLSFDVPLKMPVSLKFLATNFAVKLSGLVEGLKVKAQRIFSIKAFLDKPNK